MTPDPADPQQPEHPMYALTTFELRDYRCQLEHALKALPEYAAARAQLRQRLSDVVAEQQSRSQLQRGTRA